MFRSKRAVFQLSRVTLPRLRSGDIFVLSMLALKFYFPIFQRFLASYSRG